MKKSVNAAEKAAPEVKAAESQETAKAAPKTRKTAAKSSRTTKADTKAVAEKAVKAVEKTAEKTVKAVSEKAAEVKKEVAKASKTTTRKPAQETVYLQYLGKEINKDDLMKQVKEIWTKQMKNKVGDMKSVTLYLKPEEDKAYYVINDDVTGSIDL